MNIENTVLENVKRYCIEHGTSIAQLEKMCGIGNGVIASWGKGSAITTKSLTKIAAYTGIPAEKWIVKQED